MISTTRFEGTLECLPRLPQQNDLEVTIVYTVQMSQKRPFIMQGLLAATNAAIRAAQKRAQTERPRLQSRARQGKLQAALIDAQTAATVAQQLMQGQYLALTRHVCLMWRISCKAVRCRIAPLSNVSLPSIADGAR